MRTKAVCGWDPRPICRQDHHLLEDDFDVWDLVEALDCGALEVGYHEEQTSGGYTNEHRYSLGCHRVKKMRALARR